MFTYEDKVDVLTKLITECFVPELCQDLGEIHLNSSHFDSLRNNTPFIRLFDLIQQNEELLDSVEKETLELRSKLLLLLCEKTAPDTLYQIYDKNLLMNFNRLIEKHFSSITTKDERVLESIFDYYKVRLNATNWKKNIGAVHGFVKFCELYYMKDFHQLDVNRTQFLLSVGLLLKDFFEPSYKILGCEILNVILQRTPKEKILEMNIQGVIYEELLNEFNKIDSEDGISVIMKSILNCLEFFKVPSFDKWNFIDDLIEKLVQRILLTSNVQTHFILFMYIAKIVLFFNQEKIDVGPFFVDNRLQISDETVSQIRELSSKIKSDVPYRWVKVFFKSLLSESLNLMGNAEICYKKLQVFHIFYLICIYPLPMEIFNNNLKEFFEKFSLTLMEVIRAHKNDLEVVQAAAEWIYTFQQQIGDYRFKNNEFEKYFIAFDKVIAKLET